MSTRRILVVLAVAAFITMWGVAAAHYGSLPSRFPSHFDGAGVPDAFAEKSVGAWFALPIVFTLMAGLFAALAVFLPRISARHAALVNVPDKETFLSLPEDARARALEPMRDLMLLMMIPQLLVAAYINHGAYVLAVGGEGVLSPWPVAAIVATALIGLVVAVVRTKRAIAHEAAAGA